MQVKNVNMSISIFQIFSYLTTYLHQIFALIVGGMTWPKTGAIHFHAQLGRPYKGRIFKVLVLQWLESRAFETAKRLGPDCYSKSRDE